MASINLNIQETINRRMASTPFKWGESDCCMSVCDALVDLGYPDAAAHWRGTYTSKAGADAHVFAAGGITALADNAFKSLGWVNTDQWDFIPGNVGVFTAHSALVICDGDRWCAKTPNGVIRVYGGIDITWGPPCQP